MTTKKRTLRRAGFDALRVIRDSMPDGITLMDLADKRATSIHVIRKMMRRCQELELALAFRGHAKSGKVADYWQLTLKGQQALDEFLAVENAPKAAKPEPDEDESDPKWPRADPEEVVRQAVRTQPTSVFDLHRMMWRGGA